MSLSERLIERVESLKGLGAVEIPEEVRGVRIRRGPFALRWSSPIHSTKVASLLGIALGVAFMTCFATGLLSHAFQNGVELPSRPVNLYRVTQGVHVITGVISVPLLLAKLASVYPRLWGWPPVSSPLGVLERLALAVLIAGSIFMLSTGVFNIANWYPFGFFFTTAHYAVAWVTIGALFIHVAAKATSARRALREGHDEMREELGGDGVESRSARAER